MLQLHNLMQNLARNRPVFHSEADFQHALAWEVHLQFPDALIRMERPVPSTLGVLYVDITVQVADQTFAFELKYKTRAAAVKIAAKASSYRTTARSLSADTMFSRTSHDWSRSSRSQRIYAGT